MRSVITSRASAAWVVMVALTALSWTVGTDQSGPGGGEVHAGLLIIAVAAFKVRVIALYFMELRSAPLALRAAAEVYSAGLLVGLAAAFVAA